jgi:ABC-type transport system substrate-binding protein
MVRWRRMCLDLRFENHVMVEVSGNLIARHPSEHTLRTPRDAAKRLPQNSIAASPYELVRRKPEMTLEFEAFEEYHRPVHIEELLMSSIPEATTRIAMMKGEEADSIHSVPGELIEKVKNIRFVKAIGPRMAAEK